MAESTTVTIRVSQELKDKLEALARNTKRSKSFLAAEALATYVDANSWQLGLIRRRIKEADGGGPFVQHDSVAKWLDSLAKGGKSRRPQSARKSPAHKSKVRG
jgi:RHH-type transcriptional regulator, rel operon repressor / antitoxin RelB